MPQKEEESDDEVDIETTDEKSDTNAWNLKEEKVGKFFLRKNRLFNN